MAESKPVMTEQGDESTPKLYSVPRRYDLATLLSVTLAFSLLFGVMRFLDFEPIAFALSAAFVTLVGIAQAALFRGKSPRAASMLVGVICWIAVYIAILLVDTRGNSVAADAVFYPIVFGLIGSPFGAFLGYIVGALIGALFLVTEQLRRLGHWLRG